MQRNKILFGFILVLMLGFTTCAQDSTKSITVGQLSQKIKSDSNLVILDVRTPQELVGPLGKIKNVVNIPIQDLDKRIHELDKYKKNEIAVICKTGHRSLQGTKILLKNGFDVENVLGGMTEYRKKGY